MAKVSVALLSQQKQYWQSRAEERMQSILRLEQELIDLRKDLKEERTRYDELRDLNASVQAQLEMERKDSRETLDFYTEAYERTYGLAEERGILLSVASREIERLAGQVRKLNKELDK